MSDPLDREPSSFIAGDTVSWLKSFSGYSAADGWVLKYEFRGNTRKTVTAAASGSDHLATITAVESAAYSAGAYTVTGYVVKASERHTVFRGRIEVEPDPAQGNSAFDGRSHARKALEAIEAVLEKRATREEMSYSIQFAGSNRQLSLCPPAELIKMRNYYLSEVRKEEQAERIAQGLGTGRRILTRFVR